MTWLVFFPLAALAYPYKPAPLEREDVNEIERVACQQTFKVNAAEISGKREANKKHGSLFADVRCGRHVMEDEYQAYYNMLCKKKRGHWYCHSPALRLESTFRGMGPIDIPLEGLGVEAGYESLQCLAHGLETQVLLDFRESGRPIWIRRAVDEMTKSPVVEAYMQNSINCGRIQIPLGCAASGGWQLKLVEQGCPIEE